MTTDRIQQLLERLRGTAPGTPLPPPSPRTQPPKKEQGLGGKILSGAKGVVSVIATPGQIGSLYLSHGLRELGLGSDEEQANLAASIQGAYDAKGFLGKIRALKEAQRSRAGLFWGEKFFTEIVADPLTYTGFGLLNKIPVAGRLIRPLDYAYGRAVGGLATTPFRGVRALPGGERVFKALGDVPGEALEAGAGRRVARAALGGFGGLSRELADVGIEPTIFRTSAARAAAHNQARIAFNEFVGAEGTSTSIKDVAKTQEFISALFRMGPDELNSNPAMKVVKDIMQRNVITKNDVAEFQKLAGRKLDAKDVTVIQDAIEGMTKADVPGTKVVTDILHMLGRSQGDDVAFDAVDSIVKRQYVRSAGFRSTLAGLTPEQMVDAVARKEADETGREIALRIAQERANSARVGWVLNTLDPAYNAVWRNSIEKYMAKPFAEAVLGFANFGPMNLLENTGMILAGRGLPRFMGADEYADLMRGRIVPPAMLRSGRRAIRETGPISPIFGPPTKGEIHLPGFGETGPNSVLRRMREWGEAQSVAMKRNYHAQKVLHHERMLTDAVFKDAKVSPAVKQSLSDAFGEADRVPDVIPNSARAPFRDDINARVRSAVLSRDPEKVRSLGRHYTEEKMRERAAHSVSAKYDWDDPYVAAQSRNVRTRADIDSFGRDARESMEQGLNAAPNVLLAQMDDWLAVTKANPPANRFEFASLYNTFMLRMKEWGELPTNLQRLAHNKQVALQDTGTQVKKAGTIAFDDMFRKQRDYLRAYRKKVPEIIQELNAHANRVGLGPEEFKSFGDLATQRSETWARWWEMEEANRAAHFDAGGSAEEWVRMHHALFNDFSPQIKAVDDAFNAMSRNMDNTLRQGLPTGVGTQDLTELTERYLQASAKPPITDPRFEGIVQKFESQMRSFRKEIEDALEAAPLSSPEHQQALREYLDRVAEKVKTLGDDAVEPLTKLQDEALKRANTDLDAAFVNYDNQSTVDYLMRHVYPFWMYESRVWERLARIGVMHPRALATFGPGGTYYSEIGPNNGYTPPIVNALQAAPVRGTMLGRLRRVYQRDLPEYEKGVYGEMLKFNHRLETWGFYPGLHLTAPAGLTAQLFETGEAPRFGEHLPPSYETALSMLTAAGAKAQMPGIERFDRIFSSTRFKDREVNLWLFKQGIQPSEATREQRAEALTKISLFRALEAQVSLLRYRPKEYDAFIETKDNITALIAGITPDAMKQMKEQGRRVREEIPFDPEMRRQYRQALGEALGASFDPNQSERIIEGYGEVNRPLRTPAEREKAIKLARYWDSVDLARTMDEAAQIKDDDLLDQGIITGEMWRERRSRRATERAGRREGLLAGASLTETDLGSIYPQSEMDKALDAYYSVKPEDFPDDVGDVRWRDYFNARDNELLVFPATVQGKVKNWLSSNGSLLEQEYKQGQQAGYGDWFDEEKAVEWYAKRSANGDLLNDALRRAKAGRAEARLLQAEMAPDRERRRARDRKSERLVERAQRVYRKQLLQTKPGVERWLRKYYDRTEFSP